LSSASGALASWWRVDPKTGTTLGIGNDGSGQASTEYMVMAANGLFGFAFCIMTSGMDHDGVTYKDAMVCAGTAVVTTLGFGGGVATIGKAVLGNMISGLTTGIWLNKDQWDTKWF
jgi:hypothetical protein